MKIIDPTFLAAISAIDSGNEKELTKLLTKNTRLIHERVPNGEEGYFKDPYLLWFIAENPIRNNKLPKNIVSITSLLIEFAKQQKVKDLKEQIDYTLALVCSGKVSREYDVQLDLIDLLIKNGANPDRAVAPAIAHQENAAIEQLLRGGAKLTLILAISLNKKEEIKQLVAQAKASERQEALAIAALYGRAEVIQLLIQSGVNVNAFNPNGFHSHSTALHQVALTGSLEAIKVLLAAGADLTIKDKYFQGTPLDWAEHAQQHEAIDYLKSRMK